MASILLFRKYVLPFIYNYSVLLILELSLEVELFHEDVHEIHEDKGCALEEADIHHIEVLFVLGGGHLVQDQVELDEVIPQVLINHLVIIFQGPRVDLGPTLQLHLFRQSLPLDVELLKDCAH